MSRFRQLLTLFLSLLLALGLSACRKKTPLPPPPAPPPAADTAQPPAPPKPEITLFQLTPPSILPGQTANLSWQVTNASSVEIAPSLGKVSASGTSPVSPGESTTFTLTAVGDGGTVTQSLRLTVSPRTETVASPPLSATLAERVAKDLSDVLFSYDRHTLDPAALATVQKNAENLRRILADFPNADLILEGHCDERGSAEYNLGLGDRRVNAVKEYLESLGIPAIRLRAVSVGKERPLCTESTEDCWRKNRRVHFTTPQ